MSEDISRDADLIAEALCREMGRAVTWSHIELAWEALINTRRIQRELEREADHLGTIPKIRSAP